MSSAGQREGGRALATILFGFGLGLVAACGDTPAGPSGSCERGCPVGTTCKDGACVVLPCADGQADCNGVVADGCEVVLADDPAHCGACDHACTVDHASAACAGGSCAVDTCDAGFADCDGSPTNGCEQDTATTVTSCGGCTTECVTVPHSTATCADSTCGFACDDGFRDCDGLEGTGCEADLSTVATCGDCDTRCTAGPHATPTCTDAGCGAMCDDGWGDCDATAAGCETDTTTTEAHCGTCGHACAANETCLAGVCTTLACQAPLADCNDVATDGCEIDTSTDEAHCGMCGNACPAGATCVGGSCSYACRAQPDDPITGQKCPIETPCTAYAQCGTQQNAPTFRYWYCSTSHTCQYLPQTGGFQTAAGTCTGQLVFKQLASAPYDKRIVPPDGVAFRTGTSVALEVVNTTAADVYLDQIPLTLELAGTNPSRFDVAAVRLFQVGSISDYGDGNNATLLVCTSPTTPVAVASIFTLGTGATGGCGGSTFSRVRAGQSQRFLLNLSFAATTTFIDGRQYRLRLGSPLTGVRARPSTVGASAAVTACTLPAAGITGSYLIFDAP